LSPPDDLAAQQFGKWARARAGVSPVEQTKPELTPEETMANAVRGGADGGAGRQEQEARPRDPSDVIREAAALRKMRREL
jgi:hypothetical protein